MAYTLNYGKNSTNSLTVQDGQSGTVANLTFPGRNFSGYGSPVDQNFMLLAENFASANGANGPQYAIQGQLWYDTRQTDAVANSWAGLKVKSNNEDSSTPSWSQIVTFDTQYSTNISGVNTSLVLNPKHLTGLGNLQSNNLTVSNTSTLTGNVALGANLTVAGGATIATANISNLTVGNANLNGNLTANILKTGTTSINSNGSFGIGNTSAVITGSPIVGRGIFWDGGDVVTIKGNVTVSGALNAQGGFGATKTSSLSVSSQFIDTVHVNNWDAGVTYSTGDTVIRSGKMYRSVGASNTNNDPATTSPASWTVVTVSPGVRDTGLLFHTYSIDGTNTVTDNTAFIGRLGGAVSGVSAGNFVLATNATASSTAISAINELGSLDVGNLRVTGAIVSPAFSGILAATTGGSTNVTPSTNSITINGGNTPSSSTTAYGALDIPTGGVNIGANLRVGGTIFGKLAAVSTSAEPANLEYLKSAQSNITLANITTMVGTSVTLSSAITAPTGNFTNINVTNTTKTNVLLCNTAATVNSLTANTTVIATTGLTVSGTAELRTRNISTGAASTGGTITGAWTLTTGSTLEATYSADLAERHHADANYPTGTVMTVGGSEEITGAQNGDAVLGVVSDAWAYLMNGGAGPQETHPAVAYCGRVPVRIVGPVNKHDRVSPFKDGVAVSSMANPFGWAIESNDDPGEKLVLCIIK